MRRPKPPACSTTSDRWHVSPGETVELRWLVTPSAGPGNRDTTSKMWFYTSTVLPAHHNYAVRDCVARRCSYARQAARTRLLFPEA